MLLCMLSYCFLHKATIVHWETGFEWTNRGRFLDRETLITLRSPSHHQPSCCQWPHQWYQWDIKPGLTPHLTLHLNNCHLMQVIYKSVSSQITIDIMTGNIFCQPRNHTTQKHGEVFSRHRNVIIVIIDVKQLNKSVIENFLKFTYTNIYFNFDDFSKTH